MDYEVETPTDLRLSNTKTAEDSCNGRSAVLNSELGWSTSPGAAGVHGALLCSQALSSAQIQLSLHKTSQFQNHLVPVSVSSSREWAGSGYGSALGRRGHPKVRALGGLEIGMELNTLGTGMSRSGSVRFSGSHPVAVDQVPVAQAVTMANLLE